MIIVVVIIIIIIIIIIAITMSGCVTFTFVITCRVSGMHCG
jgi:hypothetical protein